CPRTSTHFLFSSLPSSRLLFFFYCPGDHRALHSFPTRRSSDLSSFFWTEDEINERLERMMRRAYSSVAGVAAQHKVSLRTAAFIAACSRILEAREVRGLYP